MATSSLAYTENRTRGFFGLIFYRGREVVLFAGLGQAEATRVHAGRERVHIGILAPIAD